MHRMISGFVIMGTALFVALLFRDTGLAVLHPEALIIVLGGSSCALFIGFPSRHITAALGHVLTTFRKTDEIGDLVGEIAVMARIHRKGDIRTMEQGLRTIGNDFLRYGCSLLVNRHSRENIQQSLEREMMTQMVQFQFSQNVLRTMARLTPAFGLAGTVVSLIQMFSHTHAVDALIPLMGTALMSTFYGVIIANLLLLPLAARVRDRALVSEILMYITVEGVLAIHDGENPLQIEEKLLGRALPENILLQRSPGATLAVRGI